MGKPKGVYLDFESDKIAIVQWIRNNVKLEIILEQR